MNNVKGYHAQFMRLTRGLTGDQVGEILGIKPASVYSLRCRPDRVKRHHVVKVRQHLASNRSIYAD